MLFYSEKLNAVLEELGTDRAQGLNETAIAEKREKFGENKLKEKKKKTNFQRFLDQFKDVMIIILIIAAIVSFTI
ncbi:MAG: hypothetical protein IKY12_03895, partial [Clostridia bacterium]|nr:hypothetical protein [Clostridia bacterium]